MKKLLISLLLISLCLSPAFSANELMPFKLSTQAYASVLTCGPGEEFYETFGHSAMRVCDPQNDLDVVFNYGTFDFNTPHFYLRFAQGRLDYFLRIQHFDNFMLEYDYYGRGVWEQKLNLDSSTLQNLFTSLCINALPENKYYKYDMFRDNCATRIRDMAENAVGNQLFSTDKTEQYTSYRSLIYQYCGHEQMWWMFGIDLLLGARCDIYLSQRDNMYIPMEMMAQIDTTSFSNGMPIASGNRQLLKQNYHLTETTKIPPTLVFLLLVIVVAMLTIVGQKRGWTLNWLDGILFGSAALVSVLLLFMWFGSDHYCTKWNLNLLWANPLFLWILFGLRRKDRIPTIILLSCMAATVFIWIIGWPQQFNTAAILIAVSLAIRLYSRLQRNRLN